MELKDQAAVITAGPGVIARAIATLLWAGGAAGLLAAMASAPYSVSKAAAVKLAEMLRGMRRLNARAEDLAASEKAVS